MKYLRILFALLLLNVCCGQAFSQQINVCVKVRGNTGLEGRLQNIVSREFNSLDHVTITEDRESTHLYVDFALVEQEPIRFYGLGISIAYHVRGEFYSRPTSDVAQFGEDRLEEICVYLVREIDKAYLEPLRKPPV